MTNDDLKRFYNVNDKPEQNKDFVRYGSNGEIISEHDATKDEEVVNYRTLMQHASGDGDKLYRHFIHFSKTGAYENKFTIVIDNNSQTTFDETSLKAYLYNNGFTSPSNYYPICANKGKNNNNEVVYIGIYSSNSTSYQFYFSTTEYTTDGSNITLSTTFTNGALVSMGLANDYVIEL